MALLTCPVITGLACILLRILVTTRAVRWSVCYPVVGAGKGLKVGRVEARPISALMVEVRALGLRSNQPLIGVNVNEMVLAVACDVAIAAGSLTARVEPAVVCVSGASVKRYHLASYSNLSIPTSAKQGQPVETGCPHLYCRSEILV